MLAQSIFQLNKDKQRQIKRMIMQSQETYKRSLNWKQQKNYVVEIKNLQNNQMKRLKYYQKRQDSKEGISPVRPFQRKQHQPQQTKTIKTWGTMIAATKLEELKKNQPFLYNERKKSPFDDKLFSLFKEINDRIF
ncbi:unnamed protein product [Paramecium sonneborni]|uniref:Uncharacterized protein n=1 Tax=Paramecium sonneborni TaxID=65129 RepID=A0A8S1RKG3_9CILI|nr:unnamed protein product [Paramecium sonneborni]